MSQRRKQNFVTDWDNVPVLFDPPFAALILGMHPEVVRRMVKRGEIPGFKVGKEWRINKKDFMKYLGLEESKIEG